MRVGMRQGRRLCCKQQQRHYQARRKTRFPENTLHTVTLTRSGNAVKYFHRCPELHRLLYNPAFSSPHNL